MEVDQNLKVKAQEESEIGNLVEKLLEVLEEYGEEYLKDAINRALPMWLAFLPVGGFVGRAVDELFRAVQMLLREAIDRLEN